MNREGLFALADKHFEKETKSLNVHTLMRDIVAYLMSPEGREALEKAPSWMHNMAAEEIAALMILEVVPHEQR